MPNTTYAKGITEADFKASGKSGFYSPAHDRYFFDGEIPAPLPVKPTAPNVEPATDSPAAADDKTAAKPDPVKKAK